MTTTVLLRYFRFVVESTAPSRDTPGPVAGLILHLYIERKGMKYDSQREKNRMVEGRTNWAWSWGPLRNHVRRRGAPFRYNQDENAGSTWI